MKPPNLHVFKTVTEALHIITSGKRLRQVLVTPLYSNAFYLMLNAGVMSLLGFFFWMVAARFYTEAEVGLSSAIISAIRLLAMLSLVGLNSSLIRFLSQTDKPQELTNSCFTLSGLISLVAAGIFLAGLNFWSPAMNFITKDAIFTLAFIAFTLVWTLSSLMDSAFLAKRRAEFTLFKNTIFSLLKIPLPILLVLFFHAFGIVASWGVAIGVALALSLFLLLPRVENSYKPVPTLNLNLLKDMWRYSSGNYFATLFGAASTFILPIMIVNLLGAEQNAYFYIAWMIAALLFAIPIAVSQSLFAEGSHFEDELGFNVRRSFRFIFLLLIPAVILLLLLGKWLLLLFGAGYSENALELLWILGASSLFVGVNSVYMTILRVRERIRELVLISGFVTLAVLLGSYLIAPGTGIIGVGYAWIAAQGIVSVYVAFVLRAHYIRRGFREKAFK